MNNLEPKPMPLPQRRRPAHHPPVRKGNTPVIIFLTVCVSHRRRLLCNESVHELLVGSWKEADAWAVGRYMIMPEHIHLFCSPTGDIPLRKWMSFWKNTTTRNWPNSDAKPIWQREYWDTQLRRGDSYSEKWAYVSLNPVRAGLAGDSEDWRYQGELNTLAWVSQ